MNNKIKAALITLFVIIVFVGFIVATFVSKTFAEFVILFCSIYGIYIIFSRIKDNIK